MDFFSTLLQYPFLQHALIAGVLASVALGISGTFVVVKRLSSISGGIAHAVLGGVGMAVYLGHSPVAGAFAFAVLSAIILGLVKLKAGEREDTIIAALWSIGMAVGILFMFLTPGYNDNLMTYLFGNIMVIAREELWQLLALDAIIIVVVFIGYRQFISISFDDEYARLRGLRVTFLYITLLCLIAITIVLLMRVAGLILLIALLSLPAAISALFTRSIFFMMLVSIALGIAFTGTGIFASYAVNLPAGAIIVLVAGSGYLLAIGIKRGLGLVRQWRNNSSKL